ncbi:flagellar biosynthesis protein FliQ [Marinobacter nauticus]|jgi:flagellar biosynthetic protein FliQ
MTPDTVIDIIREALWLIVTLATMIIGPGLAIGLVVSTFQAATQINEQTLSFLPRLLITLIVIIVMGPWMLTQLLDHANGLISRIPYLIG